MKSPIQSFLLTVLMLCYFSSFSQTWVDSLDVFARESYLRANRYTWNWQNAALLNTMVKQYNYAPAEQKQVYFNYIKKAMDKNYAYANGKTPNSVASGLGMAFLYQVTKDDKYKTKAEKIYADYLKIKRTSDGAVSHLMLFTELWDDTMFMIGEFLLTMYQATGDSKYLDEFMKQFRLHRDKLQDKEWGLWYHGWDSDNKTHCTFCSQMNWADKTTRRSKEIWGRGNGWIVVTLSDALEILPNDNLYRNEIASYLKEMILHLPELQDKQTGHWYQLPVRKNEPGNWIESSCTAMFAYGMGAALRNGLVSDSTFSQSIDRAYAGLRKNSITTTGKNYLITKNICTGTCIGDKNYYFKREVQKGKPYGIGMFIQFGLRYEQDKGMRNEGK
ncbi:MAG: glycoside hydrolase family 88 protein [Chitinophagales bacterium]